MRALGKLLAGALGSVVMLFIAWHFRSVLLAAVGGAYLAIALQDALSALKASLRPASKHERRIAAAAEQAFRERQQALIDSQARARAAKETA